MLRPPTILGSPMIYRPYKSQQPVCTPATRLEQLQMIPIARGLHRLSRPPCIRTTGNTELFVGQECRGGLCLPGHRSAKGAAEYRRLGAYAVPPTWDLL